MFVAINKSIDTRLARRKDGEKGFTLIELLVVVIIIGILAAIAIPVFLNQRQSAWKASVASDLKNAATLVETYATANNGQYPTTSTATAIASIPGLTDAKVSTGNTIKYKVNGTGFTLLGTNTNLATQGQLYDSAGGGIQAWNASAVPTQP